MHITKIKYIHNLQLAQVGVFLYGIERRMIVILTSMVIILALLYVFFLGSAVYYAVERGDVLSTLVQRNSNIANLDSMYLQKRSAITVASATKLGFSPVRVERYVERAQYLGRAGSI